MKRVYIKDVLHKLSKDNFVIHYLIKKFLDIKRVK